MAQRKHGEKLPRGQVKTSILLYLASKKEAQFGDIRQYLNDSYGITNLKGIRTHLADLTEDYLAIKPQTIGKKEAHHINVYHIKDGFEPFKHLFNYFKQKQLEKELMTTDYYQEYIKSDDFKLKYKISLFQGNFRAIYDRAMKNPSSKKLNSRNTSKNLYRLIEALKNNTVDELPKTILTELVDECSSFGSYDDFDDFESHLYTDTIGLNPKLEEKVLKMVACSPAVIDFILNPKITNPYSTPSLALADLAYDQKDWLELTYGDNDIRELVHSEEGLTYSIIKALYITDFVNGCLLNYLTNLS